MNIYYFANQIYQLSYAWPLYNELGGSFLVRKYKTCFKFKKYLRGSVKTKDASWLGTPSVQKRDLKKISDLSGVILSQSNSRLYNDPVKSRSVFIGHGTGDKKYGGKARTLESYKYLFLSGPKHMEKLNDSGLKFPDASLIKIGNIRFDSYINNVENRDALMKKMGIPKKARSRKNILYAPTWRWGNGTIKKYTTSFMREITREHNLIVRPHHFDVHRIPRFRLWAAANGIRNVYFSNPSRLLTNDTMQDFFVSDIMISDTSSILYEYLITGKPIIVANTDFSSLHNMPDSMNIMKIADFFDGSENILDVVNKSLSVAPDKYTEMLHKCFYFNDGRSVGRAADFVRSLESELNR